MKKMPDKRQAPAGLAYSLLPGKAAQDAAGKIPLSAHCFR